MSFARIPLIAALLALGLASTVARSQPRLSLVGPGGAAADTVPLGTSTYSLDLRLDSDGAVVSGLQFHLLASPAVNYASPVLEVLNDPFGTADLLLSPTAGKTADAEAVTLLFRLSGADYSAVSNATPARYHLDLSGLGQGVYSFSPIGHELTNASGTVTTFAAPGDFVLTIVPEPGLSLVLPAAVWLLIGSRRRNFFGFFE